MSRPFSYNDENFTVIGNVLFVHFIYEGAAEAGTRLIEIPPAIYDRLLFIANVGSSGLTSSSSYSGYFTLTVIEYNKHYFTTKSDLPNFNDRYIFGIFILKDI